MRELLTREHAQYVRLVFRLVASAVQLAVAVSVGDDVRVVAGHDGVEAEGERLLEHGGELDALVAAHARVRGAAGRVLIDEVANDVVSEALREVPDVERNAELLGGAPGIQRVFDGAAAAAAGAQRAGHAAEREVHADNLVAGIDRARRGDRRVDSTAHRCQNTHASRVRGGRKSGRIWQARAGGSQAGQCRAPLASEPRRAGREPRGERPLDGGGQCRE